MITLLRRDGTKHQTRLVFDKVKGIMALGGGWKAFAEANCLKTGDPFTLKLIWEDATPVLSLCPEECSFDRGQGGCSETNQKNSPPIEHNSCGKIIKEKDNREDDSEEETMSMKREKNHVRGRDSTSSSQKQFVTLNITPSSLIKCSLVSLSNSFLFQRISFLSWTLCITCIPFNPFPGSFSTICERE